MSIRSLRRKIAPSVLGLLLLLNTGCLLAVASVAGAGAAGYVYYSSLLHRDYRGSIPDTHTAARTALLDLKLPILNESTDVGSAYLESKTLQGSVIRVYIDSVGGSLPVDATMTRVGVRVGMTGDDSVSKRILEQISRYLPSPVPAQGPPVPPPITQTNAEISTPAPIETAPPPLVPVPVPTGAGRKGP